MPGSFRAVEMQSKRAKQVPIHGETKGSMSRKGGRDSTHRPSTRDASQITGRGGGVKLSADCVCRYPGVRVRDGVVMTTMHCVLSEPVN